MNDAATIPVCVLLIIIGGIIAVIVSSRGDS